jgi:uncharacterized repeat protein (TIGR03803 family)
MVAAVLLAAIFTAHSVQAQTYTYSVLYAFHGKDGRSPTTRLFLGETGSLYGTTESGGLYDYGTVFRLTPEGKFGRYNFQGGAEGGFPRAGVTGDRAGNLFGTTVEGPLDSWGLVFKLDARGNKTILHAFVGAEGGDPMGTLTLDEEGNLYGTNFGGGSSCNMGAGCGTVFKVRESVLTVLHTFEGPDGEFPQGRLVRDAAGNLYGTTVQGGAYGWGTIFRIDATGKFQLLYSFTGDWDRGYPAGDLAQDAAGNLFGTTTNEADYQLHGSVFKLEPSGTLVVLHNFTGGSDGYWPNGSVIRDTAGNLYGTTVSGGDVAACPGCGVVFKIDAGGAFSVIHSFEGGENGLVPWGGLTIDAAGNLYGTTEYGGRYCGQGCPGNGVVFKLTRK